MAQVPEGFQPEPGESRCGKSWQRRIFVTGELPGTNGAGRDLKHWLARVAKLPTSTVPGATPGTWYSYETDDERGFVELLQTAAGRVYRDLEAAADDNEITIDEQQQVSYLMRLAESNLERVGLLYAYWKGEGDHPGGGGHLTFQTEWPLTAGDDIGRYVAECEGLTGKWVEEEALVGSTVQTLRSYYCPGGSRIRQRADDRAAIYRLLVSAAEAIRCAHWGLWRMVLYTKARAKYQARGGGMGFSQTPGQYTPSLGLSQTPGEFVPPFGFGAKPDDLPPIPDLDEAEEAGAREGLGEGVGGAPDVLPPGLLPPPRAARSKWATPVLVGGAAALAYMVLK